MKKKIRIKLVDFHTLNNKQILEVLSEKYDVELTDKPDYIIYGPFGLEHLRYDCIRIFYTSECITPNFNECDYAIGFDRLEFGDRYMRIPLYQLFQYRENYNKIKKRSLISQDEIDKKTNFCNFVYSNCFANDVRTIIFDKLSKYKHVVSGGRYKNNIGGCVKDKIAFQSTCKFSIAFENTSYDGYATEKIMEAFAAGTVPIYYGDPRIAEDFNSDSFVNAHDFRSLDEVVERVKQIDSDKELYYNMLNVPIVKISDANLADFLYHIFDQPIEKARRRPHSQHAKSNEARQLRHAFFEEHIYKYFRKVLNVIGRLKTGTMLVGKRTK